MSAININKNNFQNEIMDSEKTVLLDFWAPWCAPCRMVVPIIEEIAGERPDIKVGKINVDEQPELASKFSIMSIPTLVVMKNGKIVQQVSDRTTQIFHSKLSADQLFQAENRCTYHIFYFYGTIFDYIQPFCFFRIHIVGKS